ncbi:unnamed protein product [Symbiodinium necroappetens]|uniref:Uncharacterized protein n=1 Tax=Symbiodinium necroappetens TaxID=1628268 RepID=A0A812WJG9_9DINO|nr:unnamed protein product [Symbiodinium necroappetens]
MTSLRLIAIASGPLLQALMLLISHQNHWGSSLLRSVILSGCVLWPGVLIWTLRLSDLPPLETRGGSRHDEHSAYAASDLERRHLGIPVRWWIAGTLEFMSLVTAIGAGMTVKFFPLFFRVDYHFTPLEVCILSCVYPLCISAMVGSLVLVLPLYLLRGALMNARGPIVRSMIMDLVTSDLRGRWNSIQSLSGFTWSGSAALGGYLADYAGDYRFTFIVTALIYTASFFIGLPLYFIYPADQGLDFAFLAVCFCIWAVGNCCGRQSIWTGSSGRFAVDGPAAGFAESRQTPPGKAPARHSHDPPWTRTANTEVQKLHTDDPSIDQLASLNQVVAGGSAPYAANMERHETAGQIDKFLAKPAGQLSTVPCSEVVLGSTFRCRVMAGPDDPIIATISGTISCCPRGHHKSQMHSLSLSLFINQVVVALAVVVELQDPEVTEDELEEELEW